MDQPYETIKKLIAASVDEPGPVAYIAKDSPTAALAFLEEVLTAAESLMALSQRGHIVCALQEPRSPGMSRAYRRRVFCRAGCANGAA